MILPPGEEPSVVLDRALARSLQTADQLALNESVCDRRIKKDALAEKSIGVVEEIRMLELGLHVAAIFVG